MQPGPKDTIKKLLNDTLSPQEKEELLTRKPVINHLARQWADTPDFARSEKADEERIWKNICKELWGEVRKNRQLTFYKIYSIAASVLLLVGIAAAFYYTPEKVPAVQMYVASSGIQNMQTVYLADGSVVKMGPASKLTYPEEFASGKRVVELSGQAFFEVAKDADRPFVVKSKGLEVTALGTAFEVFSYDQEEKMESVLLNGRIQVDMFGEPASGKPSRTVYLTPDKKLTFTKSSQEVTVETVDADKYTAWRHTGMLCFENEPLSVILPRLEKWYGRKIYCRKDVLEKYRFTFKVRDESLERILYMFRESSPLRYEKAGEEDYNLYSLN